MSRADTSRVSEHGLIERYFRPLATAPGAFSLLDDAAAFAPPTGHELVLTADGIAEGIHFPPGEAPDVVARKALRVNLSDLAAKGATPTGYLVLLGLPETWTEAWVAAFAEGLADDQAAYGVTLYGGDTIRAGTLVVSITAFGSVAPGRTVRRAGAKPGDRAYVSGTIGDGALGLLVARNDARLAGLDAAHRAELLDRYRLPRPRVALSPVVAEYASASLDVSDGLAGDLDKLCVISGVSARIPVASVPLSPAATNAVSLVPELSRLCLVGGDDYEVLCTVPPGKAADFEHDAGAAGVQVTQIGEILADGNQAVFLDAGGRPVELGRRSFSHVGGE